MLLSGKSNPGNTNYDEKSIFSNFYISSELASLSDRLCLLWTSTHDRVFRKYNFPLKNYHRYGLQFNNNHSQLFLLILLAGDVALNPGPTINSNHTSDLKLNQLNALYLNARSLHAVQKFIPVKKVKDKNSPPWIDGEVIYHIRKKYAALKKYRKTRTEYCKRKLRKISQTVKYLVKRKHQNYLLKIWESFRNNPKLFWSYHKAVFHHRSSQNAIISHNNIVAKNPLRKLNFLTPISLQFSNLQLQRRMIPPIFEFLDYLLIYS